MKLFISVLVITSITMASCSSLKPMTFAANSPKLDPIEFFGGKTESYGALEARNGKPSVEITTKTTGTVKDGQLFIEQDLYPKDGKPNHRSWKLKQIDEHHVEATANDISGKARGELYGNHFAWTFRLKLKERKFIRHVRMSQYYYLMPDGKTLIIRSVIKKFGFIVQEITEQFKKV